MSNICPVCEKKLGLSKFKIKDKVVVCGKCMANSGYGVSTSYLVIRKIDVDTLRDNMINSGLIEVDDGGFELVVPNHLRINKEEKKFILIGVDGLKNKVFDFSDLNSFESVEDGETISKGGLGSAIIGGALLGGAGMITGGVLGKKTSDTCTKLFIKLVMNDFNNPDAYIHLISSPLKKKSSLYSDKYNELHQLTSYLELIISENENKASTLQEQSKGTNLDEIKKLKELLDIDAISQEEFDEKKQQLLGLK